MADRKLVEQIAAFKNLSKNNPDWRLAFYNIAKEYWELDEHYVVLDKQSVELGYNLPLVREYKGTLAVQFFSNYVKAQNFVEKQGEFFEYNGNKLIYKVKKGAFQDVFAPFYASQELGYIINDLDEHFLDTFERIIGVMEGNEKYVVDEQQAELIEKGDYKEFYGDICKKYLIFVG